jgi:Holliday junction DNA helicase RuvA
MIARLTGLLDHSAEGSVIINVGGVGYLVFCSTRTLELLLAEREMVSVYIETHVREDHIHLYGFIDQLEQEWFKLLTTVQGVGAKVALAILSVVAPETLAQTVAAADKAVISQAPGVGPKLATRIISELKDKIGDLDISVSPFESRTGLNADLIKGPNANQATADAVSALVNLGYGRSEAYTAVAQAVQRLGDSAVVEMLIKDGLLGLAASSPGDPQ